MAPACRAIGPGRVNLIGDHTDYNQGLALPIAIDLATFVEFTPNQATRITFYSSAYTAGFSLPLLLPLDPTLIEAIEPTWGRLPGAMIALVRPERGGVVRIQSTVPMGSGLSSSASVAVALAQVFGASGPPLAIARICRQAESFSGVPVGLMDPLVCAGAKAGHASLIDFSTTSIEQVPIPDDAELVVVDSGRHRALRDTGYAARVAECQAAEVATGPLGKADQHDVDSFRDPLLKRRARHVVTECERVRSFATALERLDLAGAGALMTESHRSLADDFEVSTPELDTLVDHLSSIDGVYGARMTGAGFGGCVIALTRPGAIAVREIPTLAWKVVASNGTATGSEHNATVPADHRG
jgi:galactokinase